MIGPHVRPETKTIDALAEKRRRPFASQRSAETTGDGAFENCCRQERIILEERRKTIFCLLEKKKASENYLASGLPPIPRIGPQIWLMGHKQFSQNRSTTRVQS